jgi:hypothetical protein
MSQSKYPQKFTAEWWDLRKQAIDEIAARQRKQGIHPTLRQRAESRRNEYVAVHGREPVAETPEQHWSDR